MMGFLMAFSMRFLLSIAMVGLVFSTGRPVFSVVQKHGVLTQDESWHGAVHLVGDVVVPDGMTLILHPDVVLSVANSDVKNYGDKPNSPEIIVKGRIILPSSDPLLASDAIIRKGATDVVKIAPYDVDIQPMKDEFKRFKIQYFVIWEIH